MPEISTIQNSHVEIAKYEYPHVKGLWFSDVSRGREDMYIDVLIGADVVELEKALKVHFLPHQAVLRNESTTTKRCRGKVK